MSKAIFKFDLNNPEDNMAHFRCVKSLDMALALSKIDSTLHKQVEHYLDTAKKEPTPFEMAEVILNFIGDVYLEYNIDTDELIN